MYLYFIIVIYVLYFGSVNCGINYFVCKEKNNSLRKLKQKTKQSNKNKKHKQKKTEKKNKQTNKIKQKNKK